MYFCHQANGIKGWYAQLNLEIIRNVGQSLIWEYFFFNNDLGSVDEIL